jgi:hypothetical protein
MSFKLSTSLRQTEVSEVLSTLDKQGMKGFDISDDEMAKSHARYMIGGAKTVENERIFRFGASSYSTACNMTDLSTLQNFRRDPALCENSFWEF